MQLQIEPIQVYFIIWMWQLFHEKQFRLFVVVVVALLFYVHGKHLRSRRDGQLT